MGTIAITGVSGYLGQRLLALADADPAIERVVGVDLAAPARPTTKLEMHEADAARDGLAATLSGASALIHLAAVRDRDANAKLARSVLEAAARAEVPSIVVASTTAAYGAHADNPFPLTEASPLRPNADVADAVDAAGVESVVDAFAAEHAGVAIAVLRIAIVLGPNVENFISRMFEAPRIPAIKGHAPPLQVVHEDDAAAALLFAARRGLNGVYNVAADGWMERDEMLALSGKRAVELPEAVAFSLAERAWRLGLSSAPPAELWFLMHPVVCDNGKLRDEGWKPQHTNREALLEMVESHKPWVSLGKGRVRKADLAKGAAATVGLLGALAAARRARRRSGSA